MGGESGKENSKPRGEAGAIRRAERQRAALRENLKRRKAQAKGRSQADTGGSGRSHDSAGFVPDKPKS